MWDEKGVESGGARLRTHMHAARSSRHFGAVPILRRDAEGRPLAPLKELTFDGIAPSLVTEHVLAGVLSEQVVGLGLVHPREQVFYLQCQL